MLRSIQNFLRPGKIANEYIYGKLSAFVKESHFECTFFFKAYSPFLVSFKSFENFQLTCLQSAFLLCNSATSADRFHLKLLQLIQTNVQRAFFKRWSLVKQLNLFFLQSIVRRIKFQFSIYSCLKIVKVTVFPALIKPSWMKNLYQIFRSN